MKSLQAKLQVDLEEAINENAMLHQNLQGIQIMLNQKEDELNGVLQGKHSAESHLQNKDKLIAEQNEIIRELRAQMDEVSHKQDNQ